MVVATILLGVHYRTVWFYQDHPVLSWGTVGLVTYGVYSCFSFEVEPGNIAFLVNRLTDNVARQKVCEEGGTYFRIPILHKKVVWNEHFVRPIKCANTKNKVTLKFLVVANPVPEHLSNLYKQVGVNYNSYMEKHIDKALKEVMPNCNVKKFFSEEGVIVEEVKKNLAKKLDGNIAVDQVTFSSIIYPKIASKAKT